MNSALLTTKGHFRPYLSDAMPNYLRIKSYRSKRWKGEGSPKTIEPTDLNTARDDLSAQIQISNAYEKLTQNQSYAPSDLGRCLMKLFR